MTVSRKPVLSADATQTSVPDLLMLIGSFSPNQYLVVVHGPQDQPLGEIEIKAGMLLRAQVADIQGREAVYALFNLTASSVEVFMLSGGTLPDQPLGFLDALVLDGLRVQDELHHATDALSAGVTPSEWDRLFTEEPQAELPPAAVGGDDADRPLLDGPAKTPEQGVSPVPDLTPVAAAPSVLPEESAPAEQGRGCPFSALSTPAAAPVPMPAAPAQVAPPAPAPSLREAALSTPVAAPLLRRPPRTDAPRVAWVLAALGALTLLFWPRRR